MGLFYNKERDDPNSGTNVARAYGLINEKLKRDEGNEEDDWWKNRFSELERQGKSPASALLEQSDDPYEAPSPTERWKGQVEAMIQSGNQTLQKKGFELLGSTKPAAPHQPAEDPTSIREYRYAVNRGEFNGTYPEWLESRKTKSHGGDPYFKTSDVIFDENGERVKVPVGLRKDSERAANWTYGQQMTAEESQQAATASHAVDDLERLSKISVGGKADIYGLSGWLNKIRAGQDFTSVAINAVIEAADGPMSPETSEAIAITTNLSNTMLDAIRGAQVGPEEQKIFDRQLPLPGMTKPQFIANMMQTYKNLSYTMTRKATLRGTTDFQLPENFGTFIQDGKEYRISSDGTYEWRDI